MAVATDPRVFSYFGFVTATVAGLLITRVATVAIAGVVGLLQFPLLPRSLFAPNLYVAWGVAALALQAAGQVAAVAATHLRRRVNLQGLLASLGRISGLASTTAAFRSKHGEGSKRRWRRDGCGAWSRRPASTSASTGATSTS